MHGGCDCAVNPDDSRCTFNIPAGGGAEPQEIKDPAGSGGDGEGKA